MLSDINLLNDYEILIKIYITLICVHYICIKKIWDFCIN